MSTQRAWAPCTARPAAVKPSVYSARGTNSRSELRLPLPAGPLFTVRYVRAIVREIIEAGFPREEPARAGRRGAGVRRPPPCSSTLPRRHGDAPPRIIPTDE
ncbi:hypothetical protein EVAR_16715_1 [Eumeta japonica]|uniref:Uncharacterized protein n=1 Tax=Eumeta variegata TaxID=151549 RepID=A0A4C1V603_EUMVA|nr:hypothetical protein EVAR_16715_1 [Eumeta japonica]